MDRPIERNELSDDTRSPADRTDTRFRHITDSMLHRDTGPAMHQKTLMHPPGIPLRHHGAYAALQ